MRVRAGDQAWRLCGAFVWVCALLFLWPAATHARVSAPPGRFHSPALFTTLRSVKVSGTIAGCRRGNWAFLTVTMRQGRTRASGEWPHLNCSGRREAWSLTADVKSGRLRTGTARARAVVKILRFVEVCVGGRACVRTATVVGIRRFGGTIALRPAA